MIFVFYRKWKMKNVVVLGVRSAAHLEAFWIKQGVLFLARLCFRRVQRRARTIARIIWRNLIWWDSFQAFRQIRNRATWEGQVRDATREQTFLINVFWNYFSTKHLSLQFNWFSAHMKPLSSLEWRGANQIGVKTHENHPFHSSN